MNFFYYFCKYFFYIPLRILFPVKVINKKNFPKEKKLITISNHLSWKDVIYVGLYTPGFRHFIGKKELRNNIFGRFFTWALGAILIDRGKPDMHGMRTIISTLKKGEGIGIFPEGTRNKTGEDLQEVKSGSVMFAVKGDAPIVPVMIYKKVGLCRRNYLYIGEKFDLKEFVGKPLNSVNMDAATKIVEEHFTRTKAEMDAYVENRRRKNDRKEKRLAKKSAKLEKRKSEKESDGNA